MGGLLVVPVGVIAGGLVAPADQRLLAVAAITLATMAIGAVDDWRSLTKRHNTGLSPRGTLLLQALSAIAFLAWAHWDQQLASFIALPLGWVLPLGLLILPLGLFVFLAESNATNLTDGLDGLAAGCGAVVFTGMGLQLMLRGHGGDASLAGFCAAMAGCWLGFQRRGHQALALGLVARLQGLVLRLAEVQAAVDPGLLHAAVGGKRRAAPDHEVGVFAHFQRSHAIV